MIIKVAHFKGKRLEVDSLVWKPIFAAELEENTPAARGQTEIHRAGINGLILAHEVQHQLQGAGEWIDLQIHEKNHLHSFPSEPNPRRSRFYAEGAEIEEYKYELREHIKFSSNVVDMTYAMGNGGPPSKTYSGMAKGWRNQKTVAKGAVEYMASKVQKKPELISKLTPKFAVGCRRITPGPGYLEALIEDNTSPIFGEIARITSMGIVMSSGETLNWTLRYALCVMKLPGILTGQPLVTDHPIEQHIESLPGAPAEQDTDNVLNSRPKKPGLSAQLPKWADWAGWLWAASLYVKSRIEECVFRGLGNSVFITCAHTLKRPSLVEGVNVERWFTPNPRDYTSKITLTSGSGNLRSNLNKVLTHTLHAAIFAFARPVSELLSDTQKTSLLPYNFDVPVDQGAALFTATESRWQRKLIPQPNLLPAHPLTTSSVPTFTVTILAVNAADFGNSVYAASQNTEQEVTAAVHRRLPDEISFALKNGAACFSPVPGILDRITVAPDSSWLVKHKEAGVRGSSGGALPDCNNNPVGIEVGSEEVDGKATPDCCNYGITWRGRLTEFAMDYIVPNLNTKRKTRAAWEELLGLASKDE
ncbi:hypothetical protein FN846DRAFT_921388 [Sphaerosporella brunnea]|uniref:Uncharacterized protein n=1 Tax=Sphaerosporella brunnea TaxID=1250544 RepID=A0A5J5EMK4_9PEZI|nr:hypothetical protein FN846DRAFT_921388 [Sphaerosporella brunnea]